MDGGGILDETAGMQMAVVIADQVLCRIRSGLQVKLHRQYMVAEGKGLDEAMRLDPEDRYVGTEPCREFIFVFRCDNNNQLPHVGSIQEQVG